MLTIVLLFSGVGQICQQINLTLKRMWSIGWGRIMTCVIPPIGDELNKTSKFHGY